MRVRVFILLAMMASLLYLTSLAVNAPIQDVFFFSVRESLKEVEGIAPEAAELIEAAIAKNIDPSVTIDDFGGRLDVDWKPLDRITYLELAIMAVKIMDKEADVLKLYPLSAPTFSDIKTQLEKSGFKVGDLYYERAYGYAEYYNKFLAPKYHLDRLPSEPHKRYIKRIDVIKFIIKLAAAKFEEFGSGFGKYIPQYLKEALNLSDSSSIVDFAEALSSHLRSGPYGYSLPEDVGYIYAFEFYFLTKKYEKDREPPVLAVPILFTKTFRTFWNPETKSFDILGKYGEERLFENYAKDGSRFDATRWWTVALFAKVFATKREPVVDIPSPLRELNNVVVYRKNNAPTGQVMFNEVECTKGKIEDIKCAKCETVDGKILGIVFMKVDGKYYVVTDVTLFSNVGKYQSYTGSDFAKWYCKSGVQVEPEEKVVKFVAFGTVLENGKGNLRIDKVYVDSKNLEYSNLVSRVPKEMEIRANDSITDYLVFIPNPEDFSRLSEIIGMIVDKSENSEFDKYVRREPVTPESLVKGEKVIFDLKFTFSESESIKGKNVEILPAYDRLNHKQKPLTLKDVEEFVSRYETYVDKIEEKEPMVAYYRELLRFAKEKNIPDDAVLVALAKIREDFAVTPIPSNFRKVDLLYGELRGLERIKPVGELYEPKMYTSMQVEGEFVVPTECFGVSSDKYDIVGIKKNLCVTEVKPVGPSCDYATLKLANACKPSWMMQFDPYVTTIFQFPYDIKVVMMKQGKVVEEGDPSMLQVDLFGFKGLKVKEYVLVGNLDPSTGNPVLLKAYEVNELLGKETE